MMIFCRALRREYAKTEIFDKMRTIQNLLTEKTKLKVSSD